MFLYCGNLPRFNYYITNWRFGIDTLLGTIWGMGGFWRKCSHPTAKPTTPQVFGCAAECFTFSNWSQFVTTSFADGCPVDDNTLGVKRRRLEFRRG